MSMSLPTKSVCSELRFGVNIRDSSVPPAVYKRSINWYSADLKLSQALLLMFLDQILEFEIGGKWSTMFQVEIQVIILCASIDMDRRAAVLVSLSS